MRARLAKIQDWPELARQANWSVGALAKLCEGSVETLRKHFVEQTGAPASAWLLEDRQKRALELLRDGFSIKETAAILSYKQQSSFTRAFTKYWGVCPSVFFKDRSLATSDLRKC